MTKQLETRLQQHVQKLIHNRGGWCFKVHGSELQPAGIPDIVGCYKGLFIAVETKMPGNYPSAIQEYRMARMKLAGARVLVAYQALDVINFLDRLDEETFDNAR